MVHRICSAPFVSISVESHHVTYAFLLRVLLTRNVLNPVYTVNGMTHQDDEHSHPAPQHRKKDKPSYILQTSDIEGASCSDPAKSVVAGIVNEKRRNFRAINATDDIVSAKADTSVHSIRNNRRVDPNAPNYTSLDGAKVDSNAISAAKSIVFADLIKEHDIVWKKDNGKGSYIIASIGNIGHSGVKPVEKKEQGARRSTTPTPLTFSTNSSENQSQLHAQCSRISDVGGMDSKSSTSRRTPSEKRQSQSLQEEIRLVRELS
ncbi:hypothetical protein FI667_g12023, partial [Globisporangium splendens]